MERRLDEMKWWGEETKKEEGGQENKKGDGEKTERGGKNRSEGEESRGREVFCRNCWDVQVQISSVRPSSTSVHCPHTQQHILYRTLLNVSQSRGQLAVLSRFVLSLLSESTVCVFFSCAQTADQEADIRRLSTPSECLKKNKKKSISASDGCQPIPASGEGWRPGLWVRSCLHGGSTNMLVLKANIHFFICRGRYSITWDAFSDYKNKYTVLFIGFQADC